MKSQALTSEFGDHREMIKFRLGHGMPDETERYTRSNENRAPLADAENSTNDFQSFAQAATNEGVVPAKYKELISVAIALTTQCPYCIDTKSNNARKAGVTDAEMFEVAMIAVAMQAATAVAHAAHATAINLTLLTAL